MVATRHKKPFVSEGRDIARERTLSREAQSLIQSVDELRARVARAQGLGGLSRIRWNVLYASLSDPDPRVVDEALEFLRSKVDELEAELPAATQRGREIRATKKWEAQAVEVDPWLSPNELERKLRGKTVWLWHGTSTALWPTIETMGLLATPPGHVHEDTTPGFVYLTADGSHAYDFYARRAAAVFGGDPLLLRVAVPWDELSYDDDDADEPSGRAQFMLGRDLRPWEIREVGDRRLPNLCA
jgi:hypothetical protein